MATRTRMAYWLPVFGVELSDYTVTQQISLVNPWQIKNMITWDILFNVPQDADPEFITFEVLTCYMPAEFSHFYQYDIPSGKLAILDDGPGEQWKPIIFATEDNLAVGVYAPHLPKTTYPAAGYGQWRFDSPLNIVKWNAVDRVENPNKTNYYRVYTFYGRLGSVRDNMRKLIAELRPRNRRDTKTIKPPSGGFFMEVGK